MNTLELGKAVEKLMDENKYHEAADLFLTETQTTLSVVVAEHQKPGNWGGKDDHKHINYNVELKHNSQTFKFDFWGSQHDFELVEHAKTMPTYGDDYRISSQKKLDGEVKDLIKDVKEIPGFGKFAFLKKEDKVMFKITPNAYTILACLDLVWEDDYADWCASLGFDTDSIRARDSYHECLIQDQKLRRMFSTEELNILTSIR